MSERWKAPLAAIAASVGLIAIYLAFGGATYDPAQVSNPCEPRAEELLDDRDVFELIALSGLDGAACELQVSREELTLALADEEETAAFAETYGISEDDLEDAVRAGLVRAVDDASSTGRIDGLEATALRFAAERAPVGGLIEALQALPGDDSVQSLLLQLNELTELDAPSLDDLPSLEELEGLIP